MKMKKKEMLNALLPDLDAEEIEEKIEEMSDIIDLLINEDFVDEKLTVMYGRSLVRVKEIFKELLDAIENDNEL